jgi:hypothetical protein
MIQNCEPSLRSRRLKNVPLFFSEVVCLLDPADVYAFERLDFIDMPPKAVEHELRAGQLMPDRILGDDELIRKSEPTDLDFEQRIDRLRDLVLKLTGAEDTDPALRCEKDCKSCRIP